MDTLALNRAWMPVNHVPFITVEKVFNKLLNEKAEVIETYPDRTVKAGVPNVDVPLPYTFEALRTDTVGVWRVPSIVRFLSEPVFFRKRVRFNRHNVWLRDGGRCQYCGAKLRLDEFTYDHVKPSSQGGRTHWRNIVVACIKCNHAKAGRTPSQAGMNLKRPPFVPHYLPGVVSPAVRWREGMPEGWRTFLESVRYWHEDLI